MDFIGDVCTDQGSEPILMDPRKSLKEQSVTTSRILALRYIEVCVYDSKELDT